jgi:S1-C subfamily serine protease
VRNAGWGGSLAQNPSNQNLENIAKNITVRVIGDAGKGSGAIIGKQGNKYLIITSYHVVRLSKKIEVQTCDGNTYQAQLIGNANQKNLDLAVLQITTNNNYTVAKLANNLPSEGESILSTGFSTETSKLNLIKGEIKTILNNPFKEGYQLGFNGEMEVGMSGGAILNQNGEIIAINGRKAYPILNTGFVYEDTTKPSDSEIQQYRTLNWSIPLYSFLAQLNSEIITAYQLP